VSNVFAVQHINNNLKLVSMCV